MTLQQHSDEDSTTSSPNNKAVELKETTTTTGTVDDRYHQQEKGELQSATHSEVDLESQVFEDDETYASSNQPLIEKNNHSSSEQSTTSNRESSEENYFEQSIFKTVYKRGIWLILLLILQSFSSFILASFEALLQKHIIISLFLTMLIGTGGNSGSQSTIEIVRRITTGEIKKSNVLSVIWREFRVGILLSLFVGIVAFIRVYFYRVFNMTNEELQGMSPIIAVFYHVTFLKELIALTLSVILIVVISVLVCAAIPLFVHFALNFDAAISSGPMASVIMDLLGVSITVLVCSITL
ncbi:hypothetical protein C9374_012611 [Naegleria lovaniensis]|uniref:SLC41A/MgtE integral membrane domain-containing protein n=1 Tax=Naegleria lovaniensis TaxID=51637 RepID=A0AA88H2B6_NAELO|nr:uncharacterized protein C9374_012611 [Naegleria lovaniensis]KAG2392359.1 hypothetical protein C9374_012611 [Naegleria lovaniensis]